jgi:hypothetical protein
MLNYRYKRKKETTPEEEDDDERWTRMVGRRVRTRFCSPVPFVGLGDGGPYSSTKFTGSKREKEREGEGQWW